MRYVSGYQKWGYHDTYSHWVFRVFIHVKGLITTNSAINKIIKLVRGYSLFGAVCTVSLHKFFFNFQLIPWIVLFDWQVGSCVNWLFNNLHLPLLYCLLYNQKRVRKGIPSFPWLSSHLAKRQYLIISLSSVLCSVFSQYGFLTFHYLHVQLLEEYD